MLSSFAFKSPVILAVEIEMLWLCFVSSSIAIEELVAHSHGVSCSNDGIHNHTMGHGSYVGDKQALSQYNSTDHYLANVGTNLGNTSYSGAHSHTISIANAGGNQRHENRPPYQVISRWRRTA